MTRHQILLAVSGACLLGWWWWQQRNQESAGVPAAPTSNPLDGVSSLVASLRGGGGSASDPAASVGELLGLIGAIDASQPAPRPEPDSWVWSNPLVGDKQWYTVPLTGSSDEAWDKFDWGKCPDGRCDLYGRRCTQGYDCKPGDPAFSQ